MMRRFLIVLFCVFLVACLEEFESCDSESENGSTSPTSPSSVSGSCNINTAWTGAPTSHWRFHCQQACGLRNRGARSEANVTCNQLDEILLSFDGSARSLCYDACSGAPY